MDNWRDPWADHVNVNDGSPTKSEVTLPQPHTHAPAPALLSAFVDDAGWGSNQGSASGGWTTPPHINACASADTTTQVPEWNTTQQVPNSASWDTGEHGEAHESDPSPHNGEELGLETYDTEPVGQRQWTSPGHPPDSARWDTVERAEDNERLEHVLSKTHGSPPTNQPDHALEQHPVPTPAPPHPDDDSSARPSTSPSEASHHGAPVESPRTSFEEESTANILDAHQPQTTIETKEGTEETTPKPPSMSPDHTHTCLSNTAAQDAAAHVPFYIDAALMAELFPSSITADELDDAPDDPIYSTGARKAWYRLTRKQTMREYNAGLDDNNYIRVTWANSQIRLKVNDTIGRWAREDRISGTGAGARASFYWDTTEPLDLKNKNTHVRTVSATSNSKPVVSVRQSLPPLPSNSAVTFDWSSPTASVDSWQNAISGLQSTPSNLAPKHAAITKLQGHGARSASLSHLPRTYGQVVRKDAAVPVDETSAVRASGSPLCSNPNVGTIDPPTNFSKLDTIRTSREESVSASFDDDDEWGEMVQSPTIATPYPPSPLSHFTHSDTLPTSSTTSRLVDGSPTQDDSTDTMHASPIVRLRSTISPTSTLFKKNSFVPPSVEPGPIGPDVLKPVNRPIGSTLEKKISQMPKHIFEKSTSDAEKQSIAMKSTDSNESSAWHTPMLNSSSVKSNNDGFAGSTSQPGRTEPSSPSPQSPSGVPSIDSWADADFSFFESSVRSQPPASQHDTSDPFSIFDYPTSDQSPAQTFSRSPPRSTTPPPLQPLTGATNSVQQRKAEEDGIIREILVGLPDLMYMLK